MKKMNLEDIQELIKFVAKSGATEVDLEIDNIKISIKSPAKKRRGEVDIPTTMINEVPTQIVTQAPVVTQSPEVTAVKESQNEEDNSNYITIKSSMIGTFYRSSSPEKPSFVNIGDSIKEGDPICIIEAMKLFNEIESEVSGTIIKVLIDDATPIEFDQPLFLVDPS